MVMMLMLFMLMLMLLMLMVMTRRWGVFAPRGNQLQINSCHGASAFLARGVTHVHTCLPTLNVLMCILVHLYTLTCQLIHMALHKRINLRARRIMLYTCSRVWLSLKAATWLEVAFDWNREKVDQWVLAASARWGDGGQKGGEGGRRYYGLGAEKLTLQVQKNSGYVEISSIFLWSWKLPLKRLFSYDFWPFVPSFFLNFSDKTKFHHNAYFSCSGGIKFPYLKFQGFQGVHYLNFQGLKVFTT